MTHSEELSASSATPPASVVVNNPLGEAVPFTFELRDADGNTLHSGEEVMDPNGSRPHPRPKR